MKWINRATSWIESTPVLLFAFTISTLGVLAGFWIVVWRWSEGKEAWVVFPFLVLWSWGGFSALQTLKTKRDTRRAEIQRLQTIVGEVVRTGQTLEEAVRSAQDRLNPEELTRYRHLSDQVVNAEFNVGRHQVRIKSLEGVVTGFEVG